MNFADRDGYIWLDGEFVDWREAKVHVLTHTLHYGLGAFEGIRAYATASGPAIFRLKSHTDRLFDSAKLVNLQIPYSKEQVNAACVDLLKRNNLKSAYLRPMAFLGTEGMGLHAKNLKTRLMIAAWEWGVYLGKDALEQGIRIKTSSFRRNHIESLHATGKINGHYVNSIMALNEAAACGYDEALMLDHLGFVAEGSGENFFMVKNGEVVTPFPGAILSGITRETVMTLCHDLNIPVREANITRDQAYLADEAFFTGTAAEITPIRQIDTVTIGQGKIGPISKLLQDAYFEVVKGKNERYRQWLEFVA